MIYIIRHGETALNSRHVLQGRSDFPLNDRGVAQAEAAARRLAGMGVRFDRVFSSPLRRAIQTAGIVAPGVTVEADDRLIEMEYGPYEGMDLHAPAPEIATFFTTPRRGAWSRSRTWWPGWATSWRACGRAGATC